MLGLDELVEAMIELGIAFRMLVYSIGPLGTLGGRCMKCQAVGWSSRCREATNAE